MQFILFEKFEIEYHHKNEEMEKQGR